MVKPRVGYCEVVLCTMFSQHATITRQTRSSSQKLTTTQVGNHDVITRTIVDMLPTYILPVAQRSTLAARSRAKSSLGPTRSATSLPAARAAISFEAGLYRELGGRWCSGALAKMCVRTPPVITVATFTPKGASSRRRHSLTVVRADLLPA